MPPSNYYNWFCVANSVARIANDVARIKAAQIECARTTTRARTGGQGKADEVKGTGAQKPHSTSTQPHIEVLKHSRLDAEEETPKASFKNLEPKTAASDLTANSRTAPSFTIPPLDAKACEPPVDIPKLPSDSTAHPPDAPVQALHSSTVPSSKIARLFHYGGTSSSHSPIPKLLVSALLTVTPTGLAFSLAGGTATSYLRKSTTGAQSSALSEANINSLVEKLSRMRGAALKLGQFMSIQGPIQFYLLICDL
jgi:aarF domain-containing kinase